MVRHDLSIVSVVYNNVSWGMSLHGQEAMFGRGSGVISRLRDTDYERVALAFGADGERVRDFEAIQPAVRRALHARRPVVLNLEISGDVVHPVMREMVRKPGPDVDVVIPYYDSIPVLPALVDAAASSP